METGTETLPLNIIIRSKRVSNFNNSMKFLEEFFFNLIFKNYYNINLNTFMADITKFILNYQN